MQGGLARLIIMWTASQLPTDGAVNSVDINHFVPLLRVKATSDVVSVCVSDQSVNECVPCVSDTSSSDIDDEPAVDTAVDVSDARRFLVTFKDECSDDAGVAAPHPGVGQAQPDADESDDDEGVQHARKKMRVDRDSGKDECVVPQTASIYVPFKSNDEVYKSLRDCAPQDVLPEVPRGKKVNCSFIINNVDNVQRKSSQQCNRFWDDCGVWDRQKGHNLTSMFVLSSASTGATLRTVTLRDGAYCVKNARIKR